VTRRFLAVCLLFTALAATPAAAAVQPVPFGISVGSTDDPGRYAGWAGQPIGAARVFFSQVPTSWSSSPILRALPTGALVAFSFNSGTAAAVTAFELSRPAGTPCTATFWHEPENDGQWQGASGQAAYRAQWDYYAPAIRAGGCQPMLVLMRYTLNQPGGVDWHGWYSSSAVDVLGWDAYNSGQKKQPAIYTDPAIILDKMAAAGAEQGKPWAIAETGSPIERTSGERATWAAALAQGVVARGGLFACWWDQANPETGFDNTLDPAAAQAWHG